MYRNLVKNFLFYWMFQVWILGTEKEKRWKSRVRYFLFLSCLWEDGRLTGSNLYLAVEGENSGFGLMAVLIYRLLHFCSVQTTPWLGLVA